MHVSGKAILLIFCACLLPAMTFAQVVDPRTDARARLGPFYYTPRVAVEEFGIDTNVFNSAEQRRDFTFTLAPQVNVWIPVARRALLSSLVATDLVYYQAYASERSLNPEVRLRGELLLGRINPFAEASYLKTRQRPNFEIDARSRREHRATGLGITVRITPKLSAEIAGRQTDVDFAADATFNDVNLQETLNRATRLVSATVRHDLTALTTLVLRAEGSTERFEFSPTRDADTLRVMPGVEFKPRALISGTAAVGFRRFSPTSTSLEAFAGVVANASLNYTLLGSTRFTVSAERDVTYSYERTQPYYVVDGFGLTVRRQIVGRTDVTVGAQRQKYTYRDLLLPGSASADFDRVDVTRTWSGSFGYRLGQAARVGIGTIYRERSSNSARFRDYSGFRFATTLDYGF